MQIPITHKIVIRFNRNVASTSRLKYGTSDLDVMKITNQNLHNRFLMVIHPCGSVPFRVP